MTRARASWSNMKARTDRHRIEREQRADAGEGGAQRVNVEKVAFDHLDAGRERGLGGIAGQDADIGVALYELIDNVTADAAGTLS